ncbi:glycoside hydrolase family 5 protein [Reyranella massiliensis]|uniref:glycoside hydrolase family 5 protein n=1 Tax=Reyranella massiliensis TaxID=445220 RepID=UPI0002E565A6|nr:cellulase family glycosylhydrolase [Reyranella massiliensis]
MRCYSGPAIIERDPVSFTGQHGINVMWPFMGPLVVDPENPETTYRESVFDNPTGGWSAHITSGVLDQIKRAKFDHIRLNVVPGPWMEALGNPTRLEYLFGLTDTAVDQLIDSGLGVVVDLHATDYVLFKVRDILSDLNGNRAKYNAVVGLFADRYRTRSQSRFALTLFNEPPHPSEFIGDWATMQRTLYASARSKMTAHTIGLTSDTYANIDRMALFDPRGYDSNTLFEVHPYAPAIFAIQGYPSSAYNKYTFGLHYPPNPSEKDSAIAAMTAQVNGDSTLTSQQKLDTIAAQTQELGYYFDVPLNGQWMQAELAKLNDWMSTYGISRNRIYCGEYGCTRTNSLFEGGDLVSRAAYLRDLSRAIKLNGFRRNVFALDAPDYGISTGTCSDIGPFEPTLLDAVT